MARANLIHCCGPKLSICGALISIWGIIMLSICGALLSGQSAAFIEDIPLVEPLPTSKVELGAAITEAFGVSSKNCYGAAALYGVLLIFCSLQVWFNISVSGRK